jgi:hypothetical protein
MIALLFLSTILSHDRITTTQMGCYLLLPITSVASTEKTHAKDGHISIVTWQGHSLPVARPGGGLGITNAKSYMDGDARHGFQAGLRNFEAAQVWTKTR